jgi:hypothetical protein
MADNDTDTDTDTDDNNHYGCNHKKGGQRRRRSRHDEIRSQPISKLLYMHVL